MDKHRTPLTKSAGKHEMMKFMKNTSTDAIFDGLFQRSQNKNFVKKSPIAKIRVQNIRKRKNISAKSFNQQSLDLQSFHKEEFQSIGSKALPTTPEQFKSYIVAGRPVVTSQLLSARQQVCEVSKWFQAMKKQYINKSFKNPEKENLEITGDILKIGLKEVIAQITFNCKDRGELLENIIKCHEEHNRISWENIIKQMHKKISDLHKQINIVESFNNTAQKGLQAEIDDLGASNTRKQFIIQKKSEEILRLKSDLKNSQNKGMLRIESKRIDRNSFRTNRPSCEVFDFFFPSVETQTEYYVRDVAMVTDKLNFNVYVQTDQDSEFYHQISWTDRKLLPIIESYPKLV